MAKVITGTEFDDEVLKSDIPVMVDFFAQWCGPCKMIAPVLDELALEYDGRIKIVKVDVDASRDLTMSYGVRSMPTFLFFKGGEVADRLVGAMPKDDLSAMIDKLL